MKPINFKESNLDDAGTLDFFKSTERFRSWVGRVVSRSKRKSETWARITCYQLSDEEIEMVRKTKCVWLTNDYGFFHPIDLSVKSPFEKTKTFPLVKCDDKKEFIKKNPGYYDRVRFTFKRSPLDPTEEEEQEMLKTNS